MAVSVLGPLTQQGHVCERILRSLPDWFGIEEATKSYVEQTETLPTFIAYLDDDAAGFLTLKLHNAYAAEIAAMGVQPALHRRGIGRALLASADAYLGNQGISYLQVKTLSPSRPDASYAKTREFYLAAGFLPLEEFRELWGEANPCLQMIRYLGSSAIPGQGRGQHESS